MKVDELTKGPDMEEIVEDEPEAKEPEIKEDETDETTKVFEVEESIEEDATEDEVKDEPVPIWKRFTPDVTEVEDPFTEAIAPPSVASFELEPEPEPEIESEPLINLYSLDAEDDPRAVRIFELMDDLKSEFIESLFGGDENAYFAAVTDIAKYDTYAEAGRYIKKEILDRNRVDLYSDDAVLFLDRIQTYFVENT